LHTQAGFAEEQEWAIVTPDRLRPQGFSSLERGNGRIARMQICVMGDLTHPLVDHQDEIIIAVES
jgi:hypothetical protein